MHSQSLHWRAGSPTKTIALQSIKQLLCQSWRNGENTAESRVKTASCGVCVGVNRNRDMSSQCRHFRTNIMNGEPKLLIAYGSAAVAEGRQVNSQRHIETTKSNTVCVVRCDLLLKNTPQCRVTEKLATEPKDAHDRVRDGSGDSRLQKGHLTLRTVALFRHYIALRTSPILTCGL